MKKEKKKLLRRVLEKGFTHLRTWNRRYGGVAHIDEFYEMTDQKLQFEMNESMKRIKFLIETDDPNINLLQMAMDESAKYHKAIIQRQANISHSSDLQQLDLFT